MTRYSIGVLAASALLGLCYLLPWISGVPAGLAFSGLHLAEWTSLHPAVMAEQPALATTAALRLSAVCAVVVLALSARRYRWVYAALVIALAVGLLPPFKSILSFDNLNYRQQVIMAGLTLVLGLIGIALAHWHWAWTLSAAAALTGGVLIIAGTARALFLLGELGVPASPSFAAIAAVGLFGFLALWCVVNRKG